MGCIPGPCQDLSQVIPPARLLLRCLQGPSAAACSWEEGFQAPLHRLSVQGALLFLALAFSFSALCSRTCHFCFFPQSCHARHPQHPPAAPPAPSPSLSWFPWAATNRQLSSPAAGRGTAGEALCGSRDSCAQLVGPSPPHHASYQVAHSCRQITPLLAAGSSPFPRLFLMRLWLLFLCSAAPPPSPD